MFIQFQFDRYHYLKNTKANKALNNNLTKKSSNSSYLLQN